MLTMSALPPNADINGGGWNVCFVPQADVGTGLRECLDKAEAPKPLFAGAGAYWSAARPGPQDG